MAGAVWSELFIPTLREEPAGIDSPGRRLLVRAGYQRPMAGNQFGNLPLAMRSLARVERALREATQSLGTVEVRFPEPEPVWAMIDVARAEMRSAKLMPQAWCQTGCQTGARARGLAWDCATFDADSSGQETSMRTHRAALRKLYSDCGLEVVEAAGSFLVPSEGGTDKLVRCTACGYVSTADRAESRLAACPVPDPPGDELPEAFHTPGRKTIAEVGEFTGLPASSQMKSLVLVVDGRPLLVMVRGDHQMSGPKLLAYLGAREYRPATTAEIAEWFGAEPGSLGPVGVKLRTLADSALQGRRNMVSGANRTDYHLRNVTPGRDFQPEYLDVRRTADGDACAQCGGALTVEPALEVGHVRKLAGDTLPFVCTTQVGIERILLATAEVHRDANGLRLPGGLAPFDVVISPVNLKDEPVRKMAEMLVGDCATIGVDALYDDRDERPGVKFKDADLIGVPWRLTIGAKKLALGLVELHDRRAGETADVTPVQSLETLAAWREALQ
jgi:prolyl-tRNA synthetase